MGCWQEAREVINRCRYSATRVVLNGRPVEPSYPRAEGVEADAFLSGDFVLAESRPSGSSLRLPPAFGGPFTGSREARHLAVVTGREAPIWLVMRYRPQHRSLVTLVRHGVTEAEEQVRLRVRLQAVVDVSDLPGDLTGLRSQEGEPLQQRLAAVAALAKQLRLEVRRRLPELKATIPRRELRLPTSTVSCCSFRCYCFRGFC